MLHTMLQCHTAALETLSTRKDEELASKEAEIIKLRQQMKKANYFRTCGSLPSAVRVFQHALAVRSSLTREPRGHTACTTFAVFGKRFGEILLKWLLAGSFILA